MRKPLGALTAIVAVLALTLAACGASGGDDSASDTTTATTAAGGDTETTEADAPDAPEPDSPDTTEADEPDEPDTGDAVPVDEWAENFCGNFSDWTATIQDVGSTIQDDITPGDLEGAKTAIVGLFEDVATETEGLITTLDEGGTPDFEDGDQFVEDLSGKFQAFVDATNDTAAAAEAIPTDDPAAFQTEFTSLLTEFQTNITEVGNSFGELDSTYSDPELQSELTSACNL